MSRLAPEGTYDQYREEIQRRRIAAEQRIGITLLDSLSVKPGSPIVDKTAATIFGHGWRYVCWIHPTDLYWVLFEDEPDIAHLLVMDWMERRALTLETGAVRRLDAMYPERTWPDMINATISHPPNFFRPDLDAYNYGT